MDRLWKCWLMATHAGLLRTIFVIFSIGQPVLSASYWDHRDAVTSRKDDNLSVTCTVEGFKNFFDVIRIVHIQDSRSQPISDNGNVKLPYSQMPRYSATYSHSGDVVSVTISYRGIEPEDDGRLKCEKLGSPEESSFLNITVLSHVREFYTVAIASDGSRTRVADGQAILLEENRKLGVGCVAEVDGSVDLPRIRATIDGKDVTSMFTSTTNTSLVDLETTGLRLSRSEVSFVFSTEKPNRDFNGKVLRCSAVQSDAVVTDASSVLRVKYAPVIECGGSEWKARVGDSVKIECTVRANPSGSIKWDFASESEEELAEQQNIHFNRTNVSEDQQRVELIITHIEDSQFRGYRLKAENDVGTTNITLAVVRQTEPPVATPSRNPDSKQSVRNSNSEPLQPRQNPVIQETSSDARGFEVSGFTILLLEGIIAILAVCTVL